MSKLEFKGVKELQKHLEDIKRMQLVKEIVRDNGIELNNEMVKKAVFIGGYSTGATRRTIILSRPNEFTAIVKPHTNYASYVEYGTRFMEAQSFVRPAFRKQKIKFVKELKRLVD